MAIAVPRGPGGETGAGAIALTFASPLLKPRFVAFKLLSSLFVLAPFAIAPLLRMSGSPKMLLAFVGGTFFIAAAATILGLVSGNAKTFIVLFLSFWYVAVDDKGATPGLDFAGFNGSATLSGIAIYAAMAIAFVIAAQASHSWRLRRQY